MQKDNSDSDKVPTSSDVVQWSSGFGRLRLLEEAKSPRDQEELFIQKLKQCQFVYDKDNIPDEQTKKEKLNTLLEITEHVVNSEGVLTSVVYPEVVQLFSSNVFESLLNFRRRDNGDNHEAVFEFFLSVLESQDFRAPLARKVIDENFVLQLLELFDVECSITRSLLKLTLHRIYGRFLGLRPYIRWQMQSIFNVFLNATQRHNGIPELLEILGSIIDGYRVPLKQEHKYFLSEVLMPLHKADSVRKFLPQLAYCVIQFLEKDPRLAEGVLLNLIHYWPKEEPSKELMFLNEMEEIIDVTEVFEFHKVMIPLFHHLAKCLTSQYPEVAERTAYYWKNKYIASLVEEYADDILPIVIPSVLANETLCSFLFI